MKKPENSVKPNIKKIFDNTANVIMWIMLVVFFIFYPLYLKNGYESVASNKFIFFLVAARYSLIAAAVLLIIKVMIWGVNLQNMKNDKPLHLFLILLTSYFLSNTITFLLSRYRTVPGKYTTSGHPLGAFYGMSGWYMGYLSLILIVSLSVALAVFLKFSDFLWIPILTGGFLVAVHAVLNRYGIYPKEYVNSSLENLATIGNINWLCGFLCVIAPVSLGLYLYIESKVCRVILPIAIIAFTMALLTNGSDSGILAFGGTLVIAVALSAGDVKKLERFSEVPVFIGFSIFIILLLDSQPLVGRNYESTYSEIFINPVVGLILIILGLAARVYLHFVSQKKVVYPDFCKDYLGMIIVLTAFLLSLAFVFALVINSTTSIRIPGIWDKAIFHFDATWGSDRGGAWILSMKVFETENPLQKIFGVGQDCLYLKLSESEELMAFSKEVFWKSALTTAHCQPLNILINEGILGLFIWCGMIVSLFRVFIKNIEKSPQLLCVILSFAMYLINNLVSFRQIISTPLMVLIIVIGFKIIQMNNKKQISVEGAD